MPIKIVEYNERVAEVQYICDLCGKIVRTSIVPKQETEEHTNGKIICYNCRTSQTKKTT
ncbi:MAG: hypothetical protein NWE98_06775 [Candidatus Bathyarchaeota archaeon]|nr:hypothetical protein [Candidatus Bathyarchaeota archaeon]